MATQSTSANREKAVQLYNAYHTPSISAADASKYLTDKNKSQEKAYANQMGFYFEACVLSYLSQVSEDNNIKGGPPSGAISYSGSQKNAIALFTQNENPEVQKARHIIESSAAMAVQNLFNDKLKKLKNKKYTVTDIDTLTGTSGSPLGDLLIQCGKQNIVLELKWQSSGVRPTHWFHLVDRSLFGDDTYVNYLQSKGLYSNELADPPWTEDIRTTYLKAFLKHHAGTKTIKSQLNYFITKGQALRTIDLAKKITSKYVVHANYAGVQISNVQDVLAELEQSNRTASKADNRYKDISGIGIAYGDAKGNTAAALTLQKGKDKSKEGGRNEKGQFAFDFWITQKLLNEFSNN